MNTETIETAPTLGENPRSFFEEFGSCWQTLSSKGFFFGLLAAWLALFHFVGNSTLGYVKTSSLMGWMYNIYNGKNSDDGHGVLILPAVLILLWWKRKELLAIPQKTWWPGLIIIFFALVIHLFGFLVQQPRISIIGLFLGAYGLIGLTWGPRWLQGTFFPFVLFIFCMPVAGFVEDITFPLRIFATNITYFVTHGIFGLSVIKKGTQLLDAKGAYTYDVAAACSGLRSLIAMLALTTIYGMMTFRKIWKQILVISLAVPLAVAGNVFRLTSIVSVAEAFGQNVGNLLHEVSFDLPIAIPLLGKHFEFSPIGLFTYMLVVLALFLIGSWLGKSKEKVSQSQTA